MNLMSFTWLSLFRSQEMNLLTSSLLKPSLVSSPSVQELRALMAQAGRNSFPSSSSSSASTSLVLGLSHRADGSRTAQYSFSKAVLVSQTGGSRVLSYCEPLSCLLASQPSPHSTLVPGETHFLLPFDSSALLGLRTSCYLDPSCALIGQEQNLPYG